MNLILLKVSCLRTWMPSWIFCNHLGFFQMALSTKWRELHQLPSRAAAGMHTDWLLRRALLGPMGRNKKRLPRIGCCVAIVSSAMPSKSGHWAQQPACWFPAAHVRSERAHYTFGKHQAGYMGTTTYLLIPCCTRAIGASPLHLRKTPGRLQETWDRLQKP